MALILNLLVAVIGTAVLRAAKVPDGNDETRSTDYVADAGDPRVADEIDPHAPAHA